MSSAAHPELIVAEGLLLSLGDPAGRALETARRLLKDGSLSEADARHRLERLLEDSRGCPACGGGWDGRTCGACGHALREADTPADLPEGTASALPRELPRRKRKRKKEATIVKDVSEATVIGNPSTPGSPSSQTRTAWGGVPYAGAMGRAGGAGGGADTDDQPRIGRNMVDRVLTSDPTMTPPPNLREADGFERCASCVFFGKDECNLYGADGRDGEVANVVHRGGFPVDRDDVCDAHRSATPQVRRLVEALDREDERLAEAARAGNAGMIVRARARVARAEELLTEAVAVEEWAAVAAASGPGLRSSGWSDAARAAALAKRRSRMHGPRFSPSAAALDALKPGDTADLGHGYQVKHAGDKSLRVSHNGHPVGRAHSPEHAVEVAKKHAQGAGPSHQDKFGSTIPDRAKGEGALHYAARRMTKKHFRLVHAAAEPVIDERLLEARAALREVASAAYPGLDRSPKENWVDKAGGLPRYIERIAKHLHYEKGKEIGHAIAIAVNVVKKMCASGDTNFPGKQNVNAKSRSQACAAVAQWEAKKGKSKAKTAAKKVAEAWDDFPTCLALAEAAHRPVSPSWRFVESLLEELGQRWGRDWQDGLDALDEADELLERYAGVEEAAVTIDEAGVARVFHHVGAALHGKWDPLKHPHGRGGRWRETPDKFVPVASMEFPSRKGDVLKRIAFQARGRGSGGKLPGLRDRQRGYRHPEGATDHERMVAEMFDRPKQQTIMPAERRMLGGYLRKRGEHGLAEKMERLSARMLTPEDAASLSRAIRGEGKSMSIWREHGGTGKTPSMPDLAGKPVRLRPPEAREKPRSTGLTASEVETWRKAGRLSRPSDGGAGKDGGLADRAAAGLYDREFAKADASLEAIFRVDNELHGRIRRLTRLGRRNEDVPDAHKIDQAIAKTLQSFKGLIDWDVEKGDDGWTLRVQAPDGEHVIHIGKDAEVTYWSGPAAKTPSSGYPSMTAELPDTSPKPKKTFKGQPAAGGESATYEVQDDGLTVKKQPKPAAAFKANLALAAKIAKLPTQVPKGLVASGEEEKPYHMNPGTYFLGEDGVTYQVLASGPHLMTSKKGQPLAASHVLNTETGTEKMVPAYVQKFYPVLAAPSELKTKPSAPADLYGDIASSIGGGGGGPPSIAGKHFVVTGTVPGYSRPEFTAKLKAAGGVPHSSVTNQVDYLITGEGVGKTKTSAAAAKGVKVLSWDEFEHLLEAVFEPGRHPRGRAGRFTVSVYGGDVGGIDEDFEADTLGEARKLARRYHSKGARATEIIDEHTGHVVDLHEARLEKAERELAAATSSTEIVRLRARRNALREEWSDASRAAAAAARRARGPVANPTVRGRFASGAEEAEHAAKMNRHLAPEHHERLAKAAEDKIQPAKTQGEREHWQRVADHHWGRA